MHSISINLLIATETSYEMIKMHSTWGRSVVFPGYSTFFLQ